MKKIISFFTIALFLCFSINTYAQVATGYVFSQASNTYTPITGGTVVATATATSGAGSLDDIIYTIPNGTIPFAFPFNGISYTGFNLSSNGFITFGATAPATNNYTPISNTATYAGAVSALGGDNNALFLAPLVGEIRYETVGTEFVIQYSNFKPFAITTASPYWIWNFQIRLTCDGIIKIIYNNSFAGAPALATRQVGLRGPNNTFATNVNNRLITVGTHTWSTSVAGTSNASTCGQSTTVLPASGQTFIWSPTSSVPDQVGIVSSSLNPAAIYTDGKCYDFTATVSNSGTNSQGSIPVVYNVDGGADIGPVNTTGTLLPCGTQTVSFSGGAGLCNLSPGAHAINIRTVAGSPIVNRPPLVVNINVSAKVTTLPYLQTFTLADSWTILTTNPVGTTGIWALATAVNPDGVAADPAARALFFSASAGRQEILRSREFDFTGIVNPVLNFYVAYRSYTGNELDRMQVLVSTDHGLTFFPASTPYNKTRNTSPSLSTLPNSATGFTPTLENQWRQETVDLSNVGNLSNVVIGFVATSAFGNNAWIDNVIVSAPNSLCTDNVTGPGVYNCNPSVSLNFTATPVPHSNGENNLDDVSVIVKQESKSDEMVSNISTFIGNANINSGNQTDNPNGGTAFISTYLNNDPGQAINVNIGGTNATSNDGLVHDPGFVYNDIWFTTTYNGNDSSGYATYNISINYGSLFFTQPDQLYIVKRTDKTGNWTCLNTTRSGTVLTATGLTDFCDFGIAGTDVQPVELSSFVSTINGRNVELNWATTSESNNSGFDVERSSVNGSWTKVGNVAGNGTTSTGQSYSFTDRNVASGNYSYRLKQVDFNGNFEYHNLSNEVIIGIPTKFDLSQNYPNPFNPSTKISYDLPVDGKVSLKIFDMSGKEIMTLVNEVKTAGYYSVNFNASSLSSGVYFYSLSADNFTATKKMMLIK